MGYVTDKEVPNYFVYLPVSMFFIFYFLLSFLGFPNDFNSLIEEFVSSVFAPFFLIASFVVLFLHINFSDKLLKPKTMLILFILPEIPLFLGFCAAYLSQNIAILFPFLIPMIIGVAFNLQKISKN